MQIAGHTSQTIRRRISAKSPGSSIPCVGVSGALPTQDANITEPVSTWVSDEQLADAVKRIVEGKNLKDITLKQLRRGVVGALDLPKAAKRQLEGSRRDAFAELVRLTLENLRGADAEPKPNWQTLEDEDALTSVYLVTLAQVLGETAQGASTPLRSIDKMSREEVRDAVLDAIQNPVRGGAGRPLGEPASVLKLVVAKELPLHFHIALKLTKRLVFMPFKLSLRARSGLASHWSTSHREFWSTVRYLHFTTEHKAMVDSDKISWTPDGKALDFYMESQEPFVASAYKAKREKREAQSDVQSADRHGDINKAHKTGAVGRFTKLDFLVLSITEGFSTFWRPGVRAGPR